MEFLKFMSLKRKEPLEKSGEDVPPAPPGPLDMGILENVARSLYALDEKMDASCVPHQILSRHLNILSQQYNLSW